MRAGRADPNGRDIPRRAAVLPDVPLGYDYQPPEEGYRLVVNGSRHGLVIAGWELDDVPVLETTF